jgi:6-phosphogluconolactonase/glucosamine-6-phosphate isomerase/deaminase
VLTGGHLTPTLVPHYVRFMDVRVSTDPARDAAQCIVDRLRTAIDESGAAALAVSGGSTAPRLFAAMTSIGDREDARDRPGVAWHDVDVWQVDERIAPDGDPDRNATQLEALPARTHPMPVTESNTLLAAREYASTLPARFDVVHLGVGDDGHTASWPPRPHPDTDTALTTAERVFTIGEFNGRSRMTLGRDVVNAAHLRVVLVTGAGKAHPVARWVHGVHEHGTSWIDPTLPIAAVEPVDTVVCLDPGAAAELDDADFTVIDGGAAPGYGRGR